MFSKTYKGYLSQFAQKEHVYLFHSSDSLLSSPHCSSILSVLVAMFHVAQRSSAGWPQTWKTQGIFKIFKISGKTQGNLNFCRKNLENSGKMKLCDMVANKNAFHRSFSLEMLREKFKNALEISRKTQGISFLKNVTTLK